MNEELIVSGRMNPGIDPSLGVWHWPIAFYLFLGGLAAGLIFFAAFYLVMGKEDEFKATVKIAPIFAPIALALGLFFLLFDLHHVLYAWQLFTTIRIVSPMSWGAWTLMVITPLSIIWIAMYLKDISPNINLNGRCHRLLNLLFKENNGEELNWEWKYIALQNFEKFLHKNKKLFAFVMMYLAIILGVYTGILLSAFNARPLWNTSILGLLFLTSGLSTGAAAIMWISKNHKEIRTFSRIDLFLILIELFLIIHMMMGFSAGSEIKVYAASFFLGGEFTLVFWVFFVGMGLILPAFLEILELNNYKVPVGIVAFLILAGGLLFRFIMVDAGQVIRFLY